MADETDEGKGEINNAAPPAGSMYQVAMNSIAAYQQALRHTLAREQREGFSPLEIYLSLKTLILEVTALRELVFDIAVGTDSGDTDARRVEAINAYCLKLVQVCHANVQLLESGPRILKPS